MPPWPIMQYQEKRQQRSKDKSAKFIEDTIKWHISRLSSNNAQMQHNYVQLLQHVVNRNSQLMSHHNGLKSITMNEEQTNDLQCKLHLSHGQMDLLQSNIRSQTNKILLCNRRKMHQYRKQFSLNTGAVHKCLLQVAKHLHQKRSEMPLQYCNIYHCHKLEAIEALVQASIDRSNFKIPEPLCQSEILIEISYDKSSAGLVESVAAGVTSKFHGKYGSIVTTLAPDKVTESYNNYRELAVNWHKQDCTNSLLKYPSLIVLACVGKSNGEIVDVTTRVVMMCFDEQSQAAVNQRYMDKLNDTESPPVFDFILNESDIEYLLQMPKNESTTATYWQTMNNIIDVPVFYAVKLPDGMDPPNTMDNQPLNTMQIRNQSWKLWRAAKNNPVDEDSSSESESDSDNEGGVEENNPSSRSDIDRPRRPGIAVSSSSDNNDENSNINDNNNNNDDEDISDNTHSLYDLSEYQWNANSTLSRMAESQWNWESAHVKTSLLQGNTMYLLPYEFIFGNEANQMLPSLNNTTQNLRASLLFDNNGFRYFWLSNDKVPDKHGRNINNEFLFAVCDNESIFGILQCFMSDEQHTTTNSTQFVIQQRRALKHDLIISDVYIWQDFLNADQPFAVSMNENLTDLTNIVNFKSKSSSQSPNADNIIWSLEWYRYEIDSYLEFDNKAKNVCCGISTSACNNPCATCDASKSVIRQFPTPDNMSFSSRTTVDTIERVALKDANEIHNMGCQKVPIYDLPIHKQGPTPMHNAQGEFAIACNTFQDFIAHCSTGDTMLQMEQNQLMAIQKKYVKISHLEDLNKNIPKTDSDAAHAQITPNRIELVRLKQEYELELANWQTRMQTTLGNNHKSKFLQIMQKYCINLYYCMDNSVQGKMCQRICNARHELIELAQDINFPAGILWQHLFENLAFVYTMTKRKNDKKYDVVDLATLKQAYINLYHQLVFVVKLWRKKGKTGMKIHYTMHDIEHCMRMFMSNGRHDDERFEAVNSHCQECDKLYQGWNGNRYGCKQLFMARRLNSRALSCG